MNLSPQSLANPALNRFASVVIVVLAKMTTLELSAGAPHQ